MINPAVLEENMKLKDLIDQIVSEGRLPTTQTRSQIATIPAAIWYAAVELQKAWK